jgi:predicted CoA-binding protein
MNDDPDTLRRILATCRRIAVVGCSDDAGRPSHEVASYLQAQGYEVLPVNPNHAGQTLLGSTCVARLSDLDGPVDLVDVFRRSDAVLPIAREAVAIGARCLWQQIGVVNHEADALVRAAGLVSVMDRCTKIEHARLIGRVDPSRGGPGSRSSRRQI